MQRRMSDLPSRLCDVHLLVGRVAEVDCIRRHGQHVKVALLVALLPHAPCRWQPPRGAVLGRVAVEATGFSVGLENCVELSESGEHAVLAELFRVERIARALLPGAYSQGMSEERPRGVWRGGPCVSKGAVTCHSKSCRRAASPMLTKHSTNSKRASPPSLMRT